MINLPPDAQRDRAADRSHHRTGEVRPL